MGWLFPFLLRHPPALLLPAPAPSLLRHAKNAQAHPLRFFVTNSSNQCTYKLAISVFSEIYTFHIFRFFGLCQMRLMRSAASRIVERFTKEL